MTRADDLLTRLRAADPRVDVVVRALVAQRLGLLGDDDLLLGPVFDRLVHELVYRVGPGAALVIGAARLLERVDAVVARAHPVDLDRPPDARAVARVPLGDDGSYDVVLRLDGRITLDRDSDPLLTPDDAEVLAYALLRLVDLARAETAEERGETS